MTKRVEFLRTELYERDGRNKGPTFPQGSVWDMTDEFADRWVQRGAAVELDEKLGKLAPEERFVLVREAVLTDAPDTADASPKAPKAPKAPAAPLAPAVADVAVETANAPNPVDTGAGEQLTLQA